MDLNAQPNGEIELEEVLGAVSSQRSESARIVREEDPSIYFPFWKRYAHTILGIIVTIPAVTLGRLLRMVKRRPFARELSIDPSRIKSIVIVMLDHMGDLILSAGCFRDIRAHYPEARITLIVSESQVAAARPCPYVDQILGFRVSSLGLARTLVGPIRAFVFASKNLWSSKIDLVFNGRWDSDSCNGGLIGLYSLAPLHIGYSTRAGAIRRRVMNRWMEPVFSHTFASSQIVHEAARPGELLAAAGIPSGPPAGEVWLLPEDIQFAESHLGGVSGALIALGLGASQRRRQWPISRFAEMAKLLIGQYPDCKFLVVGNRQDSASAEELRPLLGERLLNFGGQTSVGQSAALLRRASIYVGADSGPMHLAAATGVPVVEQSCHPVDGAVQHAYSPERYHPIGVPYRVLRPAVFTPPCVSVCTGRDAHCILHVSVDDTFRAVTELLGVSSF